MTSCDGRGGTPDDTVIPDRNHGTSIIATTDTAIAAVAPACAGTWAVRWTGMLPILMVAVVSVPAVVDGVAYLAGAGKMVTFDPISHETTCDVRGGCQTGTDGILQTGGKGVEATWPHVVQLGKPFQVREPVWRWGLGEALIDRRTSAVVAVFISLLVEAAAVLVIISLVRLARNWLRHRRQPPTPASVPVT